ncbi:putative basic proline-rich protein-like [Iris pallida]|uniref:Basic proline-rich protein-like n=1 Tax=Iris pallida TaxID=29817 RepID=A0AAX6G917_IRIPA|nr:putative basic proline-rich protein-like [Iris pallida]
MEGAAVEMETPVASSFGQTEELDRRGCARASHPGGVPAQRCGNRGTGTATHTPSWCWSATAVGSAALGRRCMVRRGGSRMAMADAITGAPNFSGSQLGAR